MGISRRAALVAVAVTGLAGCDGVWKSLGIPVRGGMTDLGLVTWRSPDGVTTPTPYEWTSTAGPTRSYRLSFLSPASEQARHLNAQNQLARSWGYVQLAGAARMLRHPPPGCTDPIACAMHSIATFNAPAIQPLGQRFAQLQVTHGLDAMAVARIIVSFVQHIRNDVPAEPFGIVPPLNAVAGNRGDCDSKAILAVLLLSSIGVRAMVFQSDSHTHDMLGIALPIPGTYLDYGGTRWVMTEMTAEGAAIGLMPPQLGAVMDWRPVLHPVSVPNVAPQDMARPRPRT